MGILASLFVWIAEMAGKYLFGKIFNRKQESVAEKEAELFSGAEHKPDDIIDRL